MEGSLFQELLRCVIREERAFGQLGNIEPRKSLNKSLTQMLKLSKGSLDAELSSAVKGSDGEEYGAISLDGLIDAD